MLAALAMFGSNIFIPLVYQGLLGLSATQSGLYLAPRMVAMVAASLVSGQIVSRIDRYRLVGAAGLIALAFGLFLLSQVTASSSEAEVMRDLLLIGTGFGSNQPISQNAVMSAVPHRFVGVASSQVQFGRSLGQTVGVTVLGAVLAARVGATLPDPDAAVTTAAPAALLSLGVVSLLLKEVPMRGRRPRLDASTVPLEPAAIGD